MGEIHASAEKLEFIERAFGKAETYTKGNIQVKCPKCLLQHQDMGIPLRKRKLAINILKGDIFHCWVCGYKGRLAKAISQHCSSALLVEYLKRFADQKTLTASLDEEPKKKDVSLPMDFKLLALYKDKRGQTVKRALDYAKSRGITERDLWYLKIGISEEWPWTNRLLFPSFDREGKFNYMVGRSWLKEPKYGYWDTPVDASSIVFNEININWSKEITITEGLMDLVKCNDNAVPLLGSDLKAYYALFGMIVKNNTPVLLAMDQDTAYKKMPEVVDLFLKAGIRLRVLRMNEFNDVGEMTKEQFEEKRKTAPVWDRMSLLTHKIKSITSRSVI